MKLKELAKTHKTDKGDDQHSFRGLSYLDIYEIYLGQDREMVNLVLEIGVLHGQSLKMWRDYFPNATIRGLDIDPARKLNHGPRIEVVTGDQSKPEDLVRFHQDETVDFVVDDGSHITSHILASFEHLWPKLRPGGLYVMEDLGCTYCPGWADAAEWPGRELNEPEKQKREPLDAFFLEKIHTMDELEGDIAFVHFWPMMCFIGKCRATSRGAMLGVSNLHNRGLTN